MLTIRIVALIVVVAFAALVVASAARANLAASNPAPGRLIDVGGYRMHLDCEGEGSPTVVFEAGLLDFSLHWSRVQLAAARTTRACSYDRAGLGWSEASPLPRTSRTMVRELRTLLSNSGTPGPYVLVGHSFGGLNVRLFAQQHPEDVAGIVLVDSAHEEQSMRLPALKEAAHQVQAQFGSLASLNALGVLALSPGSIPNRGLPEAELARYRSVLAATNYFRNAIDEAKGLETSFAELRSADPTHLRAIPLVVLSRGRGAPLGEPSDLDLEASERTWHQMQSELTRLSNHAVKIVAEDSGHYIQLEQPELVVGAIRELVTPNDRSKPASARP